MVICYSITTLMKIVSFKNDIQNLRFGNFRNVEVTIASFFQDIQFDPSFTYKAQVPRIFLKSFLKATHTNSMKPKECH